MIVAMNQVFNDSSSYESDLEDPELLLNTWLGELSSLTTGLENVSLRQTQMTSHLNTPRIDSYRFSMANLEESQDVDLDAILGELCALETQCEQAIAGARSFKRTSAPVNGMSRLSHSRSSSEGQRLKLDGSEDPGGKNEGVVRTESPDNDSAFSDNVSMLSSESSASSGGSSGASKTSSGLGIDAHPTQNDTATRAKAEKIRIALEKMKLASVKKLFIKAFTCDGSTKSLLVDEKMTCGYVTRLLADKNHVVMEPKWTIVEHLPDLYMERVYEDHELLVENLMLWTRDSKNKILFVERREKFHIMLQPERFLLSETDNISDCDDHARGMLLEEFFSTETVPELTTPLYLKSESKKGWKRYVFVLRASGLYYYPKEKSKSSRDLVCLTSFDMNQVYYGIGWKKKYKAPTDFCFAIKHPRLQQPKSTKYIKFLCAEDEASLHKWVTGIRIAKHGRQLLENYRGLLDDLAQEDLDLLANARSCSVSSIAHQSQPVTPDRDIPSFESPENSAFTRRDSVHSRGGSSSSSSGCLSDGAPSSVEQGFECDFPSGTIKRKPSMNPKLPLTSITRQLKEVGETVDLGDKVQTSPQRSGTLTRSTSRTSEEDGKLSRSGTLTRKSWRRSGDDNSSNSGTLKRRRSLKKEREEVVNCDKKAAEAELSLEQVSRNLNEVMNSLLLHTNVNKEFVNFQFEENLEQKLENMSGQESSFDTDEEKPNQEDEAELPPPPPEMFESTLSLDSLPPPPTPSELPVYDVADLSCSSLSLASLPPFPQEPPAGICSPKSDLSTPISSGGATPTNVVSPDQTPTNRSPAFSPPATLSPKVPPKRIPYYSQLKEETLSPNTLRRNEKSPKKISFNFIPEEIPVSPKKPLPPRRSENTKLTTSPKKLNSEESTLTPPPKDFLKDLQRVMRKKWQVAQKCKSDTTTTPHEVLGFRDPIPTPPDYKETNVSNWLREHYGNAPRDNLYENIYTGDRPLTTIDENSIYFGVTRPLSKKRPPPPPPRSETTHLTTAKLY